MCHFSQGPNGYTGWTGSTGATGSIGDTGLMGNTGPPGFRGALGAGVLGPSLFCDSSNINSLLFHRNLKIDTFILNLIILTSFIQ